MGCLAKLGWLTRISNRCKLLDGPSKSACRSAWLLLNKLKAFHAHSDFLFLMGHEVEDDACGHAVRLSRVLPTRSYCCSQWRLILDLSEAAGKLLTSRTPEHGGIPHSDAFMGGLCIKNTTYSNFTTIESACIR